MRKPVNIYTKTLRELCEPDSVLRCVGEGVARDGGIAVAWLKSQGKPFDAADIMLVAALVDGDGMLHEDCLTLAQAWFENQTTEPSVADLCAMADRLMRGVDELTDELGIERTCDPDYVPGQVGHEPVGIPLADPTQRLPCLRCGQPPTASGHDPCIADLPNVTYACCSHGGAGYAVFKDDRVLRFYNQLGDDIRKMVADQPQDAPLGWAWEEPRPG